MFSILLQNLPIVVKILLYLSMGIVSTLVSCIPTPDWPISHERAKEIAMMPRLMDRLLEYYCDNNLMKSDEALFKIIFIEPIFWPLTLVISLFILILGYGLHSLFPATKSTSPGS